MAGKTLIQFDLMPFRRKRRLRPTLRSVPSAVPCSWLNGFWLLFLGLEPEYDAGVVAEVALVVVALGKAIAKPRQHKIKLCRPDGDGFCHGNVDPSTYDEIERIVAGVCSRGASVLTSL